MLSTAIMIRLGRIYRGLMVDMVISNDKLLHRAVGMVASIAQCSDAQAVQAVEAAGRDIRTAVLIAMGQSANAARELLRNNHGILRDALASLVNSK